jgi:RHS repeat-associated protein
MSTALLFTRFGFTFGLGLIWAGLVISSTAASPLPGECLGEAEWQESRENNRMRCGSPGFLGVTNYYFVESLRETVWKTPTNTGTAVRMNYTVTTHHGGMDFACPFGPGPCQTTISNYWDIHIPFEAYADLQSSDGGKCDRRFELANGCHCMPDTLENSCGYTNDCGNICDVAFSQLQTACCDDAGARYEFPIALTRLNEEIITDSRYVLDQTTYYSMGGGSKRERREVTRSQPFTLAQFMEGMIEAAQIGPWYDGKFFLNALSGDRDLRCLFASLLRYRIKFPSQLGVKYTVRWDLKIIQTSPVWKTNVITGLSWCGRGNGKTAYTDFFYLPPPGLNERYDGEVLNIRVESGDGCASGNCLPVRETPGDGPDFLASAGFLISLGAGTVDGSAGVLAFHAEVPSAAMTTPSALQFDLEPGVVHVVTNADGRIHVAAPTMLARLETTNNRAFWVHCSVATAGGYATNTPFLSHLVISPDSAEPGQVLQHIRFHPAQRVSTTNEFRYDAASASNRTWRLISGNGLKGESLSKTTLSPDLRLESYRIFDPAAPGSRELFRRDELYWLTNGTERLLSRIIDPAGLALTTTHTYDSLGRLSLTMNPDGSWERHEYDEAGWLAQIVRPLTNQPPNAPAGECRSTVFIYQPVAGAAAIDSPSAQPGRARVVQERIRGQPVRTTLYAFPSDSDMHRRQSTAPEPTWDDPANESDRTILDLQHRPVFAERTDGTQVATSYTDEPTGRSITRRFYGNDLVEYRRREERVDLLGRLVSRRTYDSSSGALMEEEVYSQPDEFGRPTQITYLDGSRSSSSRETCCEPTTVVDRDGVMTTFRHDALGRLVTSSRAGLVVSNAYDAADRLVARTRHPAMGGANAMLLQGLAYDATGRIIRETNALAAVTIHAYAQDSAGGSIWTTIQADGGTRVEVRHRDGTLRSVSGSATYPVRYVYGVTNDRGRACSFSTSIKLDAAGRDSGEWEQTLQDGAGRVCKTIYAGPGTPCRQSFFNRFGQLWKEQDPDGVVTLHQYGPRATCEFTAIDMDANDRIDFEGTDRITRQVEEVVSSPAGWVLQTSTYGWATNGTRTPTLLRRVDLSLDGRQVREEMSGAVRSIVRSPSLQNGHTITETDPAGFYSVSLYREGRLIALSKYDATATLASRLTFGYDLHGRRASVTDSRTGTTHFRFNDADQVLSVTIPPSGMPGEGPRTTFTDYDIMGRSTATRWPDGSLTARAYSPRGELLHLSGAGTYPASFTYDAQGRLRWLTNWSDFTTRSGPRVTTWQYDPHRGWLAAKTRADGRGPRYEFTAGGRPRSRQWARGDLTHYTYNAAGELAAIEYSDGTTDPVTYGYDRQGWRSSMGQGTENWRLFHDVEGRLLSEMGVAGFVAGLGVTNQIDHFGRRTGLTTFTRQGPVTSPAYGYDAAGRLASVADGSSAAFYSYVAGSPLAGRIRFQEEDVTRLTTVREADALDRVSAVSAQTVDSASGLLAQNYAYNDVHQPVRTTLADGSYWSFGYDPLGQLTTGRRHWNDDSAVAGQQFEYAFDHIGNRTGSAQGGDGDGAELSLAAASNNPLNQIIQQDVPAAVQIIGAATATAGVTVNGAPAHRKGEYCQAEVPVNNSVAAIWQTITCRAELAGLTSAVTGHVFVAQSPERFAYDPDGNLVQDGRWTYHWDGENRLIEMRPHDTLPAEARLRLMFTYDPLGRRTSKQASQWQSGAWVTTLHEIYLYDGWSVVATLNATNHAVVNSFVWGADLSGEVHGAGDAGGLLFIRNGGNQTSFAAHDRNGNVIGLFDAANGEVVARYEYGPFAEMIRSSGPRARDNPLRYSSQFQDEETELVYYGHRYYRARLGRWLSRDPIEHAGGLNDYTFVGNRPTDVSDFRGLAWVVKRISGEAFPEEGASMYRWLADPVGLVIASEVTENSVTVKAGGAYQGIFRMLENLTGRVWPLITSASVVLACDEEGNILGESDESLKTRDGISVAARVIVNKHGRQANVTFGAAAIFRGKLKLRAASKLEDVGEVGMEIDQADLQVSRTRTATFECRCQTP